MGRTVLPSVRGRRARVRERERSSEIRVIHGEAQHRGWNWTCRYLFLQCGLFVEPVAVTDPTGVVRIRLSNQNYCELGMVKAGVRMRVGDGGEGKREVGSCGKNFTNISDRYSLIQPLPSTSSLPTSISCLTFCDAPSELNHVTRHIKLQDPTPIWSRVYHGHGQHMRSTAGITRLGPPLSNPRNAF